VNLSATYSSNIAALWGSHALLGFLKATAGDEFAFVGKEKAPPYRAEAITGGN
jgi:hypothetical protein